jgi:hypothetical protein
METSSNFTFSFNKDIKRIVEIYISSIHVPYSFYAISDYNNTFTMNNGNITITIPPGNYTTTTICAILKSLIDSAFNDTTTNVIFSYSTFKLTITRGIAFNIDAVIYPYTNAAKILGFNTSSQVAFSVTSDSAINISGPNYIVLHSKVLSHPINNKILYSDDTYTDVLATIPVDVGVGEILSLTNTVPLPIKYSYKYNYVAGSAIDFTITDEFGNILNLNGGDVAIQLVFITE